MDPLQKPTMKAQLDALKGLQELDRRIFRLVKDRMEKPRALEALDKEVAAKRSDHEAKGKDSKAAKLEVEKRELDLKERDERKKRLEGQRDQSKTNKEYQTFNVEIGAIKAESSKIEDEILGLMAKVEEGKKTEVESKAVLDETSGRHAEKKRVVDGEIAKIDEELKGLRDKRAHAASAVDKEFLRIYDRILKAKVDSVALAPILHEGGKSGGHDGWRCGACNMDVNYQEVNKIMQGKDPISCRSCSRLLYLDAAAQTASAAK